MDDLTKTLSKITKDRHRTNILRGYEQQTLARLVQCIPSWLSSDALTVIGLMGSVIIAASFVLAVYVDRNLLLFGIFGFCVNWFGDSLDGRLAYYRNKPRKWYGFSLDYCTDWLSIVFIGLGYIVYVGNHWELWGFIFVVLYGWSMMIALLRYKITGTYIIDSGLLGPTEVRIIISLILALEVVVKGSIMYSTIVACVVLFIFNVIDFVKLLKTANLKDTAEKSTKANEETHA
ncbi:MAG: CDP-alcohol phosphatidyltransferase [Prevotellaceae bacterium]|jgi:phosphatidylglycerophosphate synthase|nr:CDP-alcohol phosphatidyltransferase [Prevotellaceae bacterium]